MKSMKKVEVIIEAVYLNRLLNNFNKWGLSGYTLIKDVEGKGGHGLKMADDVSDLGANDYIFAGCDEEKYLEFQEELRAFIKRYGGKCFVTDTMMLL